MARLEKDIADLAKRIEALPAERRLKLLERLLTPEVQLHLAVEEIRRQVRVKDERQIDRIVNEAVREVRRERARGR